jgi:Tol biopolymer transport system component/imidazolonepropionase-like amidohydrolase
MTTPSRLRAAAVAAALATLAPSTPASRSDGGDIEVTLTEGTNMAAALSPDGRALALDLLGRIWVLPAEGGDARALTDELGDARQPSWSPDGKRIAFQAYWDGNYHVWSVAADGTDLRQHTFGVYDDREPTWRPDGSAIAFASDRGGSYDLWEVDLATGAVRRLTAAPGNEYQPAYAPDGRRMAYASDDEGGAGIWLREADGSVRRWKEATGRPFGPSFSPDGKRIAWVLIGDGEAQLRLNGVDPADDPADPVRSRAGEDVFPFRPAWRADGTLLHTGDGRILRGAVAVPFRATVTLERPAYRKRLRDFDAPGPFPVKGIVAPAVAPDGAHVAFTALGDLWLLSTDPASGGKPQRLTDDRFVEMDAAWSPDGQRLAFSADRTGGFELWVRDMATGTERQLTRGGGGAVLPTWSPDGTRVAFVAGRGDLSVVTVATGGVETVRKGLNSPGRPTWTPDGRSLVISALWHYSSRFREGVDRALVAPLPRPVSDDDAVEPRGGNAVGGTYAALSPRARGAVGRAGGPTPPFPPAGRTSFVASARRTTPPQETDRYLELMPNGSVGTRGNDGPDWSPDGAWIAFVSGGVLWATPVDRDGEALGPARRLTNEVADDISWDGASESLVYLNQNADLRRVWLRSGRIETIPRDMTWTRKIPTGRRVIHAGRLYDGVHQEIRRNVDVVIDGQWIVQVAPHDPALHRGAESVIDAGDQLVHPGLIEMHTHIGTSAGEAMSRVWGAFGITALRIPAGDPYEVTEMKEAIGSGRREGPRVFGTGGTIDGSRIYYAGAPALSSSAQVELELERARDLGYDLVKTYVRLPNPVQQRVVADAHAMGMPVTSHELYPAVAFGADGVEHVRGTSRRGYSPKVTELYRSYGDVVGLLAASGMTLTPTVGIYGGWQVLLAEQSEILDDPRVTEFFPWAKQAFGARPLTGAALVTRKRMVSDMASTPKRVIDAGGRVIAGTDAPIDPYALSFLAELEEYQRYGGMTELEALRSATSWAADALGYTGVLGCVAPGCLADVVVGRGLPGTDMASAPGR